MNKLARSRLKWTGHVERMGDEKLAKRVGVEKVEMIIIMEGDDNNNDYFIVQS